jgi:hypothetical protein
MVIAALSWPEAVFRVSIVVGAALVVSVLIWSIFQTGRTAISNER